MEKDPQPTQGGTDSRDLPTWLRLAEQGVRVSAVLHYSNVHGVSRKGAPIG